MHPCTNLDQVLVMSYNIHLNGTIPEMTLTLYTLTFLLKEQAVSGRKNRVQLRSTPLPLHALASRGAGLVGRTLDEQQAGRCC